MPRTVDAQISAVIPGNTCNVTGTTLGSASFMLSLYRPMDFFIDGYGNSYIAGYRMGPNILGNQTFEFQLAKYNQAGILQWQNNQLANSYLNSDNYRSTFITSVVADENKNVYIAGCFSSEKLVLDTITRTFPNNTQRGFIARLDSNGVFVWFAYTNTAGNHIGVTSLEISGNRLYASISEGGQIRMPDGNVISLGPDPVVFVMSTSGQYIRKFSYSFGAINMNAALFNADPSFSQVWSNFPVAPQLKISSSGNLMMVGRHDGLGVTVGSDTLYDPDLLGMIHTFCAVLDTNSGWINAFPVCYTDKNYSQDVFRRINRMPVFTVDGEDNLYYADNWTEIYTSPGMHDTVFLADRTALDGATPSASVLMAYDYTGQRLWHSLHSDISWASVEAFNGGLYGYGTYSDTLLFTNADQSDTLVIPSFNGPYNLAVMSCDLYGTLNWGHGYGGTNMDMAYHLRKSPCSDDFICLALQSSASVVFNQSATVNVPQADRIHMITHSVAGACNPISCWQPLPLSYYPQPADTLSPKLYPVPCVSGLTISNLAVDDYTVALTDVLGNRCYTGYFSNAGTLEIPTAQLAAGVYLVQIISVTQTFTARVIVER